MAKNAKQNNSSSCCISKRWFWEKFVLAAGGIFLLQFILSLLGKGWSGVWADRSRIGEQAILSIVVGFLFALFEYVKRSILDEVKSKVEGMEVPLKKDIEKIVTSLDNKLEEYKTVFDDTSKEVKDNLSESKTLLSRADIVVYPIKTCQELDEHLVDIAQKIFLRKSGILDEFLPIYAIDWNSPYYWIQNDVLAYLATQASWRAHGNKREVYRFFVWDPWDIETKLGEKMINVHLLLGFHTYLTTRKKALALLSPEQCRDILFWGDPQKSKAVQEEKLGLTKGFMSKTRFGVEKEIATSSKVPKGLPIARLEDKDIQTYYSSFEKLKDDKGSLKLNGNYYQEVTTDEEGNGKSLLQLREEIKKWLKLAKHF